MEIAEKQVFQIGDKVFIRPDSEYYGDDVDRNPADVEGVVFARCKEDYFSSHHYYVRWPGSYTNIYRPEDLQLTKLLTIEEVLGNL